MKKSSALPTAPPRGSMTPSSSKISDYQNKLQSIKQRFGKESGVGSESVKQTVTKGNNVEKMNTSFSAMNNSISKKWNEISKKKTDDKKGSGMSNTIGGGFKQVNQMNTSQGAGSVGAGSS